MNESATINDDTFFTSVDAELASLTINFEVNCTVTAIFFFAAYTQTEPIVKGLAIDNQAVVDILPCKNKTRNVGIECNMQPKHRTRGTRTVTIAMYDVKVQCNKIAYMKSECDECIEEEETEFIDDVDKDSTYVPTECEEDSEEFTMAANVNMQSSTLMNEKKFIVFESTLLSLFTVCLGCKNITQGLVKFVVGSMVAIEQNCTTCKLSRL